jgi:hypothetical protein
LLLIPGIAAASQAAKPWFLGPILAAGLFAPVPLDFVRASIMSVAWLFTALMLAMLATIGHAELAAVIGGLRSRIGMAVPRLGSPAEAPGASAALRAGGPGAIAPGP